MELTQFMNTWLLNFEVQALCFFASVAIAFDFLRKSKLSFTKVIAHVLGSWGIVNLVCLVIFGLVYKGN